MTTQNYLQIQNNVVTNIVIWDGNTSTWTPPSDASMFAQETTLAEVWVNTNPINETPNWILQEVMGAGDIGFTWDGTILMTNQPQPQ